MVVLGTVATFTVAGGAGTGAGTGLAGMGVGDVGVTPTAVCGA